MKFRDNELVSTDNEGCILNVSDMGEQGQYRFIIRTESSRDSGVMVGLTDAKARKLAFAILKALLS